MANDSLREKLYSLGKNDVVRGIITAAFGGAAVAAVAVLQSVFSAPGFDVFAIAWTGVLHNVVNAAIIGAEGGLSGYIMKNFFSDENGKVFGRFG